MKRGDHNKSEAFFKNLALLYAEKSGSELQKELAALNSSSQSADDSLRFDKLDEKIKSRIKSNKIKKWTVRLTPLAACFIILTTYLVINMRIFYGNILSDSSSNDYAEELKNTPSPTLTFEFVSAKLPKNYTLKKTDYDYQKVIYYIINSDGTEIILSIEEYTGNINTEGFDRIPINDQYAYGITTADYSFIQYQKDDFLYMLTTPGDYDDLIIISKNLI